ncbi:MAG: hypothetical protein ACLFR0_05660 [Alphaproteobacteria bacterium]
MVSPQMEELRDRGRAQMQEYRRQQFDLDAFEFLPLENGNLQLLDQDNERLQAWLHKNDQGDWDVVFLDRDSAQNLYETFAEPILERQRESQRNPETDGELRWFPNLSGTDDRPVPEGIKPFWILRDDASGEVSAFHHEHFHLTDTQGNIIELQDGLYPPHVFDLESGRLANGYFMAVNPENPPNNLAPGMLDNNGYVDITRMHTSLGWLRPDPQNPSENIRFHPAEEGFVVAFVQTNGVEPSLLEPAQLIGQSAAFDRENIERLDIPADEIVEVEIEGQSIGEQTEVLRPDNATDNPVFDSTLETTPEETAPEETTHEETTPAPPPEADTSYIDDIKERFRQEEARILQEQEAFEENYESEALDSERSLVIGDKEHYYEFAQSRVSGILEQEGGLEALTADFLENNDPSVYPLQPVLDENGVIKTSVEAGVVYTHWENATNGQGAVMTAGQIGRELEGLMDTHGSHQNIDAYLQENPEVEPAMQMLSAVLTHVQETEQNELENNFAPARSLDTGANINSGGYENTNPHGGIHSPDF